MSEVKFIVCNYFCLLATVQTPLNYKSRPMQCQHSQIFERSDRTLFCALPAFSLSKARFLLVHNIEHLTSPALVSASATVAKACVGEICYVLTTTFISINLQTRLNLLQTLASPFWGRGWGGENVI